MFHQNFDTSAGKRFRNLLTASFVLLLPASVQAHSYHVGGWKKSVITKSAYACDIRCTGYNAAAPKCSDCSTGVDKVYEHEITTNKKDTASGSETTEFGAEASGSGTVGWKIITGLELGGEWTGSWTSTSGWSRENERNEKSKVTQTIKGTSKTCIVLLWRTHTEMHHSKETIRSHRGYIDKHCGWNYTTQKCEVELTGHDNIHVREMKDYVLQKIETDDRTCSWQANCQTQKAPPVRSSFLEVIPPSAPYPCSANNYPLTCGTA